LDLFDGFDELDHMIGNLNIFCFLKHILFSFNFLFEGKNYYWITKPEFLQSYTTYTPRVPQKYRILVDCSGII